MWNSVCGDFTTIEVEIHRIEAVGIVQGTVEQADRRLITTTVKLSKVSTAVGPPSSGSPIVSSLVCPSRQQLSPAP